MQRSQWDVAADCGNSEGTENIFFFAVADNSSSITHGRETVAWKKGLDQLNAI